MHPSSYTPAGHGRRRSPITQPGYRKGLKPPNAGKRYPAEVLEAGQVLAVLERCPLTGPHRRTGVRNRALFTLLWRSGLRIEEALSLEPKDVDLARGTIAVLRGKGGNRRTVPIDRHAAGVLLDWLELRAELLADRGDPELAGPDYGPLFCVVTRPSVGRRLQASTIRESLKLRADQAGLRRRVHPHALRHTFASEVYFHEGAQVADVQLALGHRHASTTDRYIHRIAGSRRLLELLRDRPWPDHAVGS
ncbi:MAG: tyrosine-type recombinase/integrase [Actinomycetota bacterium]|nr:tyrosine-type recombinase/integrase [Actinomycetota bacterium]